jgi:hypothetical protein
MVTQTDVFAFRAKINKLFSTMDAQSLTESEKRLLFYVLNQVLEISEETLR